MTLIFDAKKEAKEKCRKVHKVMLFSAEAGKVFPIDLLVQSENKPIKKRSGRWRSCNKEAKNGRKKTQHVTNLPRQQLLPIENLGKAAILIELFFLYHLGLILEMKISNNRRVGSPRSTCGAVCKDYSRSRWGSRGTQIVSHLSNKVFQKWRKRELKKARGVRDDDCKMAKEGEKCKCIDSFIED